MIDAKTPATPRLVIVAGACVIGLLTHFLPWVNVEGFVQASVTGIKLDDWRGVMSAILLGGAGVVWALPFFGTALRESDFRTLRIIAGVALAIAFALQVSIFFELGDMTAKVNENMNNFQMTGFGGGFGQMPKLTMPTIKTSAGIGLMAAAVTSLAATVLSFREIQSKPA
ncbi:MAG: hypothetical protein AAF517_09425 [Planctomycetota bacterium]